MEQIDQELLDNLLQDTSFINWAKKSNRNDIQYWNSWIRNNESKIKTIDTAKSIILGISFQKTKVANEKVETELNSVLNTINKTKTRTKRISSYIPYGIAATVAILFIFLTNNNSYKNSVTHKTAYGEIINLSLPDGTKVVLNGNSEINYTKENPRDIVLTGEAYFKVKPVPATKAKFWVTTKDLKVEVYGTQFHVNTREEKTDVVLDEGSIHLLLDNGLTKKMIPGEFVSFSKSSENITHKKVDLDVPYSLWRDGTYIFNNLTLKEVMKNMEYTYGIEVKFLNEKLKEKLITGGIPNENLMICLAAIEKSADITIIKKDNTIELTEN
ncbi:FecR family protein [uncultured Maribacter sp.]|uniref:FecR family protein n=1 Tax=uncultured Maribacter sp. TaxID=431308 RepID=UPI002624565D|nr:FecR family protein [uncultured Maribacter sp.]